MGLSERDLDAPNLKNEEMIYCKPGNLLIIGDDSVVRARVILIVMMRPILSSFCETLLSGLHSVRHSAWRHNEVKAQHHHGAILNTISSLA